MQRAAKPVPRPASPTSITLWVSLRVACPYNLYDRVRLEAEKRGAVIESTDYGAEITALRELARAAV